MKYAEFASAGARFQYGHKFGAQFGGSFDGTVEEDAPETSVLPDDELEFSDAQPIEDLSSETNAPESDPSEDDALELAELETETPEGEEVENDGAETVLSLDDDDNGDDDGGDADSSLSEPEAEVTQTVTATYSAEAIAELKFMIEEEKLAGDIYEVFYNMYGLKIFNNIAQSEDQHFNALINQAETIGLDVDQFLFAPVGSFDDPELQEMYDTLLAQGSVSETAALEVGKAIEEKDMVDIAAAIEDVEGTTLAEVYDSLLTGSSYHLEAFENLLA